MDATNDDAAESPLTDIVFAEGQQDGGYPRYGIYIWYGVVMAKFIGLCLKLHWIVDRNMSWGEKWKKLISKPTHIILSTMFSLLVLDLVGREAFVGDNMFVWKAKQDGQPVAVLAPNENLAAQELCYRFRVEDVTAACSDAIEKLYECEVDALEMYPDQDEDFLNANTCNLGYSGCEEFLPGGSGADLFSDCMSLPSGSLDRKSCKEDILSQNVSSTSAAINFFDNLFSTNWIPKLAYGISYGLDLVFASLRAYSVNHAGDFNPNAYLRMAMNGCVFGISMSVISLTYENGCFETLTPGWFALSQFIRLQRTVVAATSVAAALVVVGVKYPEKRKEKWFQFLWFLVVNLFVMLQLASSFFLGAERIAKSPKKKKTKTAGNVASVVTMLYGVLMSAWLAYEENRDGE